jgi:hypothetical protein
MSTHRERRGRSWPSLLPPWCVHILFFAVLTAATPARGQDPGAATSPAAKTQGQGEAKEPLPMFRGQLVSRYWLRWTGSDRDQDLYETLSLDIGDPEQHAVTGYLQGRLSIDLDGSTGSQPFASLDDSHGHNPVGHLYYAYADLHRVDGFSLLRLGRQTIHDTPEVAFLDGVRAESATFGGMQAQIGAYGGVSTHLYESSISGDWMMGLYVQGRPWTGGRLRLDWMHLEDEALLGAHNDDLYAAGVWQTAGAFELEGQYSRLESKDRDVRGRATFSDAETSVLLQLSYYQLLHPQQDLVLELDPFFSATQELFPYQQFGFLGSKGLWEQLDLRLGIDVRRVRDAADIGTYNHDYERYFGTVAVRDLFTKDLTVSLTGDLWASDMEDIRTWGADASYKANETIELSAGSYYSLYKFDLQLNSEIDHVRTYYGRLRCRASKSLTADLAVELEDNDLDRYYTLRMGATWKF